MPKQQRPRFSVRDRNRLAFECGLFAEQIDGLENALPSCAAALSQPAKLEGVRSKLSDASKYFERARKAAETMLAVNSDACVEARNRIFEAEFASLRVGMDSPSEDRNVLTVVRDAAAAARHLADVALERLPKKARHWKTGDPRPVQMIESALQGAHQALDACLQENSQLIVSDIQGKLCVNGKDAPEARDFRAFMVQHDAQSIIFSKGLTLQEVTLLIEDIVRRGLAP